MSLPLVLMWHGFEDRSQESDPYYMFVPGSSFARQLDILAELGSHFLTLDEYLAGLEARRWPPRSILITIDDGYVSTLTVAAPALAARGVPAVMFAVPGRLGGTSGWMPRMPDEPLLDADGLRELEKHGVRVEAHGWDHRTLPGLAADELRRQVEIRGHLADVLGRRPIAFAYPVGLHDDAARAAVERAGYTCAFAVGDGDNGPFALRRRDVNSTDTELTFRLKTTSLWPVAYSTVGRLGPLRRGVHRLLSSRG